MVSKKHACFVFALLFLTLPSISQAKEKAKAASSSSWGGLKSTWKAFLDFPSQDNFDRFVKVTVGLSKGSLSDRAEALDYLFQNSGRLFGKIQALDAVAVDAAFNLLPLASGEFYTKINSNLGELLSISPTLFLQGLKQHREKVQDLKALLTTLTDTYAKDPEAPNNQRITRIRILQSVNDPELSAVKGECLKVLE